ncbi:hypothetical protein QQX98_006307 [Neonectria punicea]|uniref:Uncharacterized protein n=1 Tax=Neonectria punicea TaxID=979145 RepID=A0ABR1H2P4_9HYPO
MKFSVAITALISVMTASAFPVHKREIGGVLMCTGVNATGTCHYDVYELNKCHQLPEPFLLNINTFAPDGEDFSCYPRVTGCDDICRSPTGCTFGAVDFNYEHKYDLGAIKWDKLFKSFDCTAKKWSSNSTSTRGSTTTRRTAY